MQRSVKIALWAFSFVVLLVVAFYQIENWRGRVALTEWIAELKAAGEPLTLDELIADPPLDEENFFKAPFISSLVDYRWQYSKGSSSVIQAEIIYDYPEEIVRLAAMILPRTQYLSYLPSTGSNGFDSHEVSDLEAWAEVYRADSEYDTPAKKGISDAQVILRAIDSRFGEELELLKKASVRPYSYFPVNVGETLEENRASTPPVFDVSLRLSKLLNLRMSAAIMAGEREVFRDSMRICIRFNQGLENNRLLFSNLILSANHSMLLGTLWGGLSSKSFSEDDLIFISSELHRMNLKKAALLSFRGSRIAYRNPMFEISKRSSELGFEILNNVYGTVNLSYDQSMPILLIPDGWWDQNQVTQHRVETLEIIERWKTLNFSGTAGLESRYSSMKKNAYTFLAAPPTLKLMDRGMRVYVLNEMAILACEVEIFALRHSHYPENLNELIPSQLKSIPIDPFDGKQIRYIKLENRYLIYSVGLNEKDDLGFVSFRRPGSVDVRAGDWVWDYRDVEKRQGADISREEFLDKVRTKLDPNYDPRKQILIKKNETKKEARQRRNLEKAVKRIEADKERRR